MRELIVDNFAGGGGASCGIESALGRPVDIAINHSPAAMVMHEANHPRTRHLIEDVFKVKPREATGGAPVGLAWFSPDCFAPGTMILTERGYRPIETIREGDMVLTHNGRYRRVLATMSAAKPVRSIDIQGVPTIRVSGEHPFLARATTNIWDNANRRYRRTLCAPEWILAKDLRTGPAEMNAAGGDRHFCATPCTFPDLPIPPVGGRGIEIDERLMWLAGRYVGDGWTRLTHERAELVIICGKSEAVELEKTLAAWPRQGDRAGSGELAWHQRETRTACQFSTNHRGLVEWLRAQFGHGAGEKGFPAWALGCQEALRRSLLEGYVSADGSVLTISNNAVIETTTVSRALAFSTKALAESLGHTAQVFSSRQNSNAIEGRTVNVRPCFQVRWRSGVPLRAQTLRDGLHNWSRVQHVSAECAADDVFNLSVEDDESYVADGIVVHNCTHFSKAKGGKPVSKNIRGLAWAAVRWAKEARPRVIILENVEEFKDWGPLGEDGRPDKKRRGLTFRRFVGNLRSQGYNVEWRELVAADYGAPTTRKRLFLIARCDGSPIVWPEPTHRDPRLVDDLFASGLRPWRTAAECIDWLIPCPSIFTRKRPLADKTLARIAEGIRRYVIECADPFIVGIDNQSSGPGASWSINDPLRTITLENRFALVVPKTGSQLDHSHHVFAMLVAYFGNERGGISLRRPLRTVTSKDRMGLVLIHGTSLITDIGLRMLTPRELAMAQGFPQVYVLTGTATSQVARIGNSVCPPVAEAIVSANLPELIVEREEAVA